MRPAIAKIRVLRPKLPGQMNRLERDYSIFLNAQIVAGVVRDYRYEAVKLRLADRTWYTPDFEVINALGYVEYHEVKGFMRDDAAVKLKIAAEHYPERAFVLVRRERGEWVFTSIGQADAGEAEE